MSADVSEIFKHAVDTKKLREKVRAYSAECRSKIRAKASDSLRFGLGEIQGEIQELDNLSVADVKDLALRIKQSRHAGEDDMYKLSHAFLQDIENIRAFSCTAGAMQILIKELTGNDIARRLSAADCLCNLSLGDAPVCEKIANLAGSYLVTYLDGNEKRLRRTCLWVIANVLETSSKGARRLLQMSLFPKLWTLYTAQHDFVGDHSEDAGICLQLIVLNPAPLLTDSQLTYIREHLDQKRPDDTAGELYLQIIFHCGLLDAKTVIDDKELRYIINYALNDLVRTTDFVSIANRMRIIYAIRVLSNIFALWPQCLHSAYEISQNDWRIRPSNLLKKLFSFKNEVLMGDTLWLLKNMIEAQSRDPIERGAKILEDILSVTF